MTTTPAAIATGTPRRVRGSAALAALALLLVGCAPTEPAPPASPPAASAVAIPETAVGEMTQWILGEMNGESESAAADWAERLHADFTAEVSADEVAALINRQIRPARPLTPLAYRGDEGHAVTTIAGALGDPFDLDLTVDDGGLIVGLWLGPVQPSHTPAASMDEIRDRLAALPGAVRALITLDGEVLYQRAPDAAAPIGSMFKLYVLAAVADAVAAGTVSWDDTLTVTADVRSLPSGELQDAPEGTEVTVRDATEKMISISDNTATDMLIALVGRDAVEAAVAALGHHEPGTMRPFLTTREAFALLWGRHEDLRTRWTDGDEAARRTVLAELAARPFDIGVDDVDDAPGWAAGIEWFATAHDIAAAHAGLSVRAESMPQIAEILAVNPGVGVDAARWPVVAFKGGSSPGAVSGSWRAVDADGRVLMMTLLLSDEDAAAVTDAQPELFGLAADVFAVAD